MMLCTKGFTRASQHVLPKARAASSSGRKRSAKPCSCCSARFSLQQPPGSTRWCQALANGRGGTPPGKHGAAVAPCPAPCQAWQLSSPTRPQQPGPLADPRPCPHWALGPLWPLPNWGAVRHLWPQDPACTWPTSTRSRCASLCGAPLWAVSCAYVPSLNVGDPKVALALPRHLSAPLLTLQSPHRLTAPSPKVQGQKGRDGTARRQLTCQRVAAAAPGPGRSPGTRHVPERCKRGTSAGTAAP